MEILSRYSLRRPSWVIGVTGPPGVGKSSIIDLLIEGLRKEGRTVAVLTVDPTSPFTGGAFLGDRVRMTRHALDSGIFIRSMASRGAQGGVSEACASALFFLESKGWDVIIIETVGVGQDHVEIRRLADTVIVVLSPGLGDEVQHFKAGIMEVGDLYVVNKSDLPGADKIIQQVRSALSGAPKREPPVIKVSAKKNLGIDVLLSEAKKHRSGLSDTALIGLRKERIMNILERAAMGYYMKIAQQKIKARFNFERLANDLIEGRINPRQLLRDIKKELTSPL